MSKMPDLDLFSSFSSKSTTTNINSLNVQTNNLSDFKLDKDLFHTTKMISTTTPILNQSNILLMINQELNENSWDYMTELIFILLIAILTIPANLFLIFFYAQKVRHYKRIKHLNASYARIANSFHTYLIEMCLFDTIIVIYLVLNTTFKVLSYLGKSPYESPYDISNFTCKFFIYIVRISGAMSNYLVFLLSLNRCLLIFVKYKPKKSHSQHRICFNTKYLTLFLFCICTIANVFRLELLNINSNNHMSSGSGGSSSSPSTSPHSFNLTNIFNSNNKLDNAALLNSFQGKEFDYGDLDDDEENKFSYRFKAKRSNNLNISSSIYSRKKIFVFQNDLNKNKFESKFKKSKSKQQTNSLIIDSNDSSITNNKNGAFYSSSSSSSSLLLSSSSSSIPIDPINKQSLLSSSLLHHQPSQQQQLQSLIEAAMSQSGSGSSTSNTNECGPNMRSVSFSISDSTNTLFWSIFVYNLIFSIVPLFGNLILSVYLIRKRSELKVRLKELSNFLMKIKLEKIKSAKMINSDNSNPKNNNPNNPNIPNNDISKDKNLINENNENLNETQNDENISNKNFNINNKSQINIIDSNNMMKNNRNDQSENIDAIICLDREEENSNFNTNSSSLNSNFSRNFTNKESNNIRKLSNQGNLITTCDLYETTNQTSSIYEPKQCSCDNNNDNLKNNLNNFILTSSNLQGQQTLQQNNNVNESEAMCLRLSSKFSPNSIHLLREPFRINEFQAEFLKTCTPCIAFSLTHVILLLPYTVLELTNQILFNFALMYILQYMTYVRYLFYCSKFYLLLLVSYRFRRELARVFKCLKSKNFIKKTYGINSNGIRNNNNNNFKQNLTANGISYNCQENNNSNNGNYTMRRHKESSRTNSNSNSRSSSINSINNDNNNNNNNNNNSNNKRFKKSINDLNNKFSSFKAKRKNFFNLIFKLKRSSSLKNLEKIDENVQNDEINLSINKIGNKKNSIQIEKQLKLKDLVENEKVEMEKSEKITNGLEMVKLKLDQQK